MPKQKPRDAVSTGSTPDAPAATNLPVEIIEEIQATVEADYTAQLAAGLGDIPRAINWRALSPLDLEQELLDLNAWVDWVRHEYGLPAQVIPPMWHRHPELVWELSALKQYWLTCYDPQARGSAPIEWHQAFHTAKERLRDWVSISGTKLDRDRPTRQTTWPGGETETWQDPATTEIPITDRTTDFLAYLDQQVSQRQEQQDMIVNTILEEERVRAQMRANSAR